MEEKKDENRRKNSASEVAPAGNCGRWGLHWLPARSPLPSPETTRRVLEQELALTEAPRTKKQKAQRERERERRTWILTSLNSSSFVILEPGEN
jgi:hypothetical protein